MPQKLAPKNMVWALLRFSFRLKHLNQFSFGGEQCRGFPLPFRTPTAGSRKAAAQEVTVTAVEVLEAMRQHPAEAGEKDAFGLRNPLGHVHFHWTCVQHGTTLPLEGGYNSLFSSCFFGGAGGSGPFESVSNIRHSVSLLWGPSRGRVGETGCESSSPREKNPGLAASVVCGVMGIFVILHFLKICFMFPWLSMESSLDTCALSLIPLRDVSANGGNHSERAKHQILGRSRVSFGKIGSFGPQTEVSQDFAGFLRLPSDDI